MGHGRDLRTVLTHRTIGCFLAHQKPKWCFSMDGTVCDLRLDDRHASVDHGRKIMSLHTLSFAYLLGFFLQSPLPLSLVCPPHLGACTCHDQFCLEVPPSSASRSPHCVLGSCFSCDITVRGCLCSLLERKKTYFRQVQRKLQVLPCCLEDW